MKIIPQLAVIAASCLPAAAQTVAIPSLPVTLPARTVPSQTITINVPKNGGKMSVVIPSQILAAQTTSTAPVTAPVSMAGVTWSFKCTAPSKADGTPDLQNVSCQVPQ
jgi:hypothetical protein